MAKRWRKNSELVATTCSTNFFLWAYAFLAYYTINIPYLAPVCFLLAIINLLSPALCRFMHTNTVSHVGMIAGTAELSSIIYFTGGYQSESVGMYGIIPLICGLQTGKSGLKIWVPVAFIMLAGFWALHFNHISLENFQNSEGQALSRFMFVFAWLALCTAIVIAHLSILESKEKLLAHQNVKIKNLLRVVLHDFTTPIAVIGSTSRMRLKDNSIGDHKEEFLKINKYVRIIEEIIKSAKELYIASNENKDIELEPIFISESINRVVTLQTKKIKAKNLQINIGSFPDVPIEGLRTVFEFQIIQNVLTNAIKFTPLNGEINILAFEDDYTVTLVIQDSGIGMSQMDINKLFTNNFAPSKKGTAGESGTGFGLLITKHYLDMFNAGLKISSQVEGPSTGTKVELVFNKFRAKP